MTPPGEGNDYPLQYSCLENSMDRRSLVGYSLWGCKELDMNEQRALTPYTVNSKWIVQLPSRVKLFVTPWTAACQASLSFTILQSLLKFIFIELVMLSNISSSAASFSFCLQTFPVSRSFPMSQLFTSGGQSIGASASVFPMNSQGWFLLGLTSLISLLPKGLSSLLQRHNLKASILHHSAFFMTQLSLSYMNTGKTWFIDGCGGRVKGALWGLF